MREKPVGRMLVLTTMLLAALIFANGCRSTSALPATLTQGAPTKLPDKVMDQKRSPSPNAVAASTPWKKSAPTSSAAPATESSTKPSNPVRPVAHYPLPVIRDAPAPFPDLMPREKAEPLGLVQPITLRHGSKHSGKVTTMIAPNAPTESSPVTLPAYTIRPPDVLIIESRKGLTTQPIQGQHLVRPDGTVSLGIYPPAHVAGKTIVEARLEIAKAIFSKLNKDPVMDTHPDGKPKLDEKGKIIMIKPFITELKQVLDDLSVDVLAYNSSVYYVITDGAGLGEQVYRFPVTGSETVLDAISHINGLPLVSSPRRIWVARRNEGMGGVYNTLAVDWKGITQQGAMNTNWQVMPGDRIYVQADPVRRFNNTLGKFLEPLERVVGATLLTGQTVNTIRSGTNVLQNR